MDVYRIIQLVFQQAPPILFALTIHEFAHGWVADKLGDPTARSLGRLTFNPLAHLDPIGTIMLFLVQIGWAKPVPVDWRNLRNPKKDMVWIAAAGPGANILSAVVLGIIFRFIKDFYTMTWPLDLLIEMLYFGVRINLILALFNLLPIPLFDGSRIVAGFLPPEAEWRYRRLELIMPFLLFGVFIIDHLVGGVLLSPVFSALSFAVGHISQIIIGSV